MMKQQKLAYNKAVVTSQLLKMFQSKETGWTVTSIQVNETTGTIRLECSGSGSFESDVKLFYKIMREELYLTKEFIDETC